MERRLRGLLPLAGNLLRLAHANGLASEGRWSAGDEAPPVPQELMGFAMATIMSPVGPERIDFDATEGQPSYTWERMHGPPLAPPKPTTIWTSSAALLHTLGA